MGGTSETTFVNGSKLYSTYESEHSKTNDVENTFLSHIGFPLFDTN